MGLIGTVAPVWLLVYAMPVWGVVAALAVSGGFTGLVNAPAIGFLTMRVPESLRAQVITALITANTVAAPIAYAVTGPIVRRFGLDGLYAIAAAGETAGATLFTLIALRHQAAQRQAEAAAG
ncbi:MAG TPA: hypothetical protein VMU66_00390 [Gaiellales bacterium]|nr:hypothetical protein [Gaiellales bacterium]